jgi:TetR/AcrR family transcriptional regulator
VTFCQGDLLINKQVPRNDRKTRDASRSRRAILDAAERLFAQRGFAGTTMQEVGESAGMSRGAPAYFFGSKRSLYKAVVQRVFEDRHQVLAPGFAVAEAIAGRATGRDAQALEQALETAVGAYQRFLAARPTFVRLMQWEALEGALGLRSIPHRSAAIEDGLRKLAAGRQADIRQLVLSFVALCFFPFEHGATLLPALGLDAADDRFLRARAEHVARLLAGALAEAEP